MTTLITAAKETRNGVERFHLFQSRFALKWRQCSKHQFSVPLRGKISFYFLFLDFLYHLQINTNLCKDDIRGEERILQNILNLSNFDRIVFLCYDLIEIRSFAVPRP